MSSETVTRNDLTNILNEVLPPTPSEYKKLLWTNPSPTSSFAAQTVSLDLSDYDEVEIAVRLYSGGSSPVTFARGSVGLLSSAFCVRNDSFLTQIRQFTPQTSGVQFYDCKLGSNSSTYNDQMIPLNIYGIKYERVNPPQVEMADCVVEEGTDGIWNYRKWNSGIAECWCLTSVVSKSVTTSYGYGYYAPQDTFTLPSGLFVSISNAQVTLIEASASGKWFEVQSANTTEIRGYIFGIASNVINAQENIYVKGKWK